MSYQYRVQLKLGSRTITEYVEASNVSQVLSFYQTVSVAQVSQICKIEYEDNTRQPNDNMDYFSKVKVIARNNDQGIARQYIFSYLKPTLKESELYNAMVANLSVGGFTIKSLVSALWTRP